ncbi:MAG TPA: transporter substrate-binding domain-containing protein, partial [Hyphomicrobiales bacterium]|nr:transporter substrate-binding domain-containing protein [Hyphomicrobiales bacterium]
MLAVTDRRQQQARLVEPYYYATTIALLARPKSGAKPVSGLSGETACVLKGAYYAEAIAEAPTRLKTIAVRTMDEARTSLENGKCDTIAGDIATLIQQQRLHKSLDRAIFIPTDVPPLPWAIAINKTMAGSDFEQLISDAVADWHKSGKLKALEKKWLGRNTEWVLRQHEAYQ